MVEETPGCAGIDPDRVESASGDPGKFNLGIKLCVMGKWSKGDAFQEYPFIPEGQKPAIDP